ncbi:hypothetical protein [Algoriphagus aquimarinus]|uniref:Uncharacterized protein n=1 Tax=Algoriphagus aquimarinus TaxID=237018 RepID=A0A5C7AEK5_9BACT|nr:hypothetical protein [Algoriphagus aquimarinus]TXE06707.1 hypothetical protein ESV85_16580 [Algoriphagus aquimarinus]
MKKDIDFSPVTGVKLAIAKEETAMGTEWAVYIINLNMIELKNVMITSKGYGEINGEIKKTSTLRHMLDELSEQAVAKIEAIDPSVFALNNEFWVSYYIMDQIFDKKFIFTSGSFDPCFIKMIPEIGLEGVLHA